jgi:hypothetical protein
MPVPECQICRPIAELDRLRPDAESRSQHRGYGSLEKAGHSHQTGEVHCTEFAFPFLKGHFLRICTLQNIVCG